VEAHSGAESAKTVSKKYKGINNKKEKYHVKSRHYHTSLCTNKDFLIVNADNLKVMYPFTCKNENVPRAIYNFLIAHSSNRTLGKQG